MDIQIFEYLNNQLKDERKLFLLIFGFNLLFFISGLALGYDVHHFADKADTDGASYYNIALDPFSSSPEESGFRHATFLLVLSCFLELFLWIMLVLQYYFMHLIQFFLSPLMAA